MWENVSSCLYYTQLNWQGHAEVRFLQWTSHHHSQLRTIKHLMNIFTILSTDKNVKYYLMITMFTSMTLKNQDYISIKLLLLWMKAFCSCILVLYWYNSPLNQCGTGNQKQYHLGKVTNPRFSSSLQSPRKGSFFIKINSVTIINMFSDQDYELLHIHQKLKFLKNSHFQI